MQNSSQNLVPRTSTFFRSAARRIVAAGAAGMLTLSLVACGAQGAADSQTASAGASQAEQTTATTAQDATQDAAQTQTDDTTTAVLEGAESFSIDTASLFSDRDLDASYDAEKATAIKLSDSGTEAANGVKVDGSTVTIQAAGTYVVSGSLSDGRLVVDVPDTEKVQIVLDSVSISSSSGTALYVKSADKVFVTLAKGSTNTIASTGDATSEDDHTLDGAVYACDDLTVNGEGALTVTSAKGHGLVAKDELTLVSGTLDITAEGHAIQAKDSLAVKDGTYKLTGGSDGVHVEHDSDGQKGFAYVAGGTWTIDAGSDGFDTSNDLLVDGGSITVSADDDGLHSEYDLIINAGTIRVADSYEGLEGARIQVNGGDVDVVASDDGINAAGNPNGTTADDAWQGQGGAQGGQMPQGGQMQQDGQSPQNGQSSQNGQSPQNGQMPQEGQTSQNGQAPQGDSSAQSGQTPQDGQMPQDGSMPQEGQMHGHGMGGGRREMAMGEMVGSGDGTQNMRQGGGGGFERDDTASITVSGGKVVVDAGGDGIDSNGAVTVTGGELYVSGPTSEGDGAIDAGGEVTVSGGTVIAVGSMGMVQGFGSSSTQGAITASVQGTAGSAVEIKDASGKVLASFSPTKAFQSVVASAPGMQSGSTYTVSTGSQSVEATA